MRTLKSINNKYFICSGNDNSLYKKINENQFVAYYGDNYGLYSVLEKYEFQDYPTIKIKYVNFYEYQLIMGEKYKISDLFIKYFGN